MNIQKVKQGAKITYYNGIFMILFGIYFIAFIALNMKTSFSSINQLWGFFSRFNTEITYLFYLFNILIGILLIAQGITITYLSDFIVKRKDKMTWVILFINGLITWAGLLTITFLLKNLYLMIPSLIGWLTFIIGMLIPI